MIIGSVLDVSTGTDGLNGNGGSGQSVVFYTESDALEWCQLMSETKDLTGGTNALSPVTVFINTATGSQRWWWKGTEYTG